MTGGSGSRLYREQRNRQAAGGFYDAARWRQGFTIIEVLIVLAVTGFMLMSALLLINGKQRTTAFNQSIRNIQTEIQQILGEVGSGYYPDGTNLTCVKSGGNVLLTAGVNAQGTNKDCVFIGKILQFNVDNKDPQEYNVYMLVGLRGDAVTPSTDLSSAKARIAAKGTTAADVAVPDIFTVNRLQYGLTVSRMYYNGATNRTIGAVGLTSNLNTIGSGDGSQQVNVVALPGTTLGMSKAEGVGAINDNWSTGPDRSIVNPTGGVQICFDSGGTDQSGLITIGGAGRQGTVQLRIYNNRGCV